MKTSTIAMEMPVWDPLTLEGKPAPLIDKFLDKIALLLLFNIGNEASRDDALPFSKKIWHKYPDINIVGIHVRGQEAPHFLPNQIRYVTKKKKIPFPVFQDNSRSSFIKYAVEETPHWILLNQSGEILQSIAGAQPQALRVSLQELFRDIPSSIEDKDANAPGLANRENQ